MKDGLASTRAARRATATAVNFMLGDGGDIRKVTKDGCEEVEINERARTNAKGRLEVGGHR